MPPRNAPFLQGAVSSGAVAKALHVLDCRDGAATFSLHSPRFTVIKSTAAATEPMALAKVD